MHFYLNMLSFLFSWCSFSFFFFKHLNSLLMFSSCVNSESSFHSISLLRRNSNAKALGLCVCLAVFVGFSSMNFTSLNAHQRMWRGEKKQCWGLEGVEKERERERRGQQERRPEEKRRGREGLADFCFFFTLFAMKSRSQILLHCETDPRDGAFFSFFHLVIGDKGKCCC